MLKEPKVSKSI